MKLFMKKANIRLKANKKKININESQCELPMS